MNQYRSQGKFSYRPSDARKNYEKFPYMKLSEDCRFHFSKVFAPKLEKF